MQRVQLIRREVREALSPGAVEVLFEHAELMVEGAEELAELASLAIVHAESPEDCFSRMVTMMLMTGIRLSNAELQKQVARAVDMIVHVELYNDGVRRIANITDVVWDEEKQKTYLHDIWYWKQTGDMVDGVLQGDWVKNRRIPSFMQKFIKHRVEFPKDYFDKE